VYSLPQKLVAEFLGTFALIFLLGGVVCADQYVRSSVPTASPAISLFAIAVAYGLGVATLISSLGHISGGHFNPAVTVAFWATRRFGTAVSLSYWVAQILGGIMASYLLRATLPDSAWAPVALGAPALASDVTRVPGMVLEATLTFVVVFVFFAAVVDTESLARNTGGMVVGFAVMVAVLLGGPFTGAAMNPVRAFAPGIAARHWTNQGIYWIGPLFGGLIAGWLYDSAFLRDSRPRPTV
jgi:MIP family channel proteins